MMKNTLRFSLIIYSLFGLFLNSNVLGSDWAFSGLKLSNANLTEERFTAPPVCNTPTWPSTSNITQTSATFSWSPVSGALSYSVQTRIPNGTWYNAPGSPFGNTSVTVDGFNPGTTYEWRVRANCSYGDYSNWTAAVTFTTSGSSCYAPDWLSTTNITQTTATWNWSSVSGAVSYSIQWRYAGGTWYDLGGGPWTSTWINVGNLQPGTAYEWRVRSNCGYGIYSSWSYPESFTTAGSSCSTPTWPSTSNITQTSATFSWSPVYGAQSYSVQTRLPNGTWYDAPGSPFTYTSVTVSGFSPGTTYQWRVRANCGYGQYSYWTSPITFTTAGGSSCNTPHSLYTSNITQTSAKLNWSSVSGAVSYSIQWRYAGGTWYDLGGGPWMTTYLTLGGLQPGTGYEWRVRSNCGYGIYSPWSYGSSFTTLGSSCNKPAWPSTSNITQTTATFSWSPVYGAQSYSVQTRLPNGTWYDAPGSPFTYTSVTISGFSPGTTYEWRVRANCGYGQYSDWTYPISFTTSGGSSCHPPYSLYTSYITQTSAKLNWSSVYGAVSYSIQWRYPGGTWYDLSGGPWTSTHITLSGLQPGTSYEWRVRSNCGYGIYSPWSYPAYFTTLGHSCSTPTWPSTYNITQTTATFSWSSVPGAQSYTVQTRLPNGTWYDIPGGPVYSTWVTVSGLYPNTTYQWRVRANCGYSQYSNWTYPIQFTTSGGSSCYAPYTLYTTYITQTSAKLNWSPASGAISYSIQWRYPGGTWYDLQGGPWSSTHITLTGLQPGTSYEWRVRSNCHYGSYSSWSHASYFTTLGQSCATPTWPSTTNITETTATFSWSGVSGATSYTVQTRLPNGVWYDIPGGPVSSTWVTVSGLNPNTTYQWRVRANCGYSNYSDWTYPIQFTTSGGSSCHAPTSLYTSHITQTSAKLNWAPVSGAINYSIQWRYANGTWFDLSGGPWTGTQHTLSGLIPGTAYEWRIRSNCHGGIHSAWSGGSVFTTLGTSCFAPTALDTSDITETSATLSWSPVSGAQSYSVQLRVPNGSWAFAPGSPFIDTSVTVNNLNPGTTYEWRVRANCGYGNQSDWTSTQTFTTQGSDPGSNDECIEATLLTVNSACENTPASNAGATPSSPFPMGWCPTNWYKDVWFKFTMPDVIDPTVTIRTTAGTLTDAVMEIYSGDCSNLTYVTCEDDNTAGNGSPMPVINLSGNPNTTVWVRVWGYAGTTGTFSICVFDYHSNNLNVPDIISIQPDAGIIFEPVQKVSPASDEANVSLTIGIAPNPVKDVLYVTYAQTEESFVSGIVMMDMSGKTVIRKAYIPDSPVEFREQLDVSGLAPGIYVLQVMTTSGLLTERISVVE